MPANIVLRHIGMSTSVGRLTLTTRAIYFERFGASSKDKADRYDLSEDLKQVVKRDLTGPWGAHLFDNAVMYKASSLAEPIFFEFPQFIGHSRRDYWLAIIREVLYAHRFIRKHNLMHLQREEALSMAAFGVFRYRVIKDHFHVIPTQFRATLLFNLAEKLPKGDKILEALYKHLEDLTDGSGPSPFALYALDKMGFRVLPIEQWRPGDGDILLVDVRVGEASSLQKAVKKTICYSGRAEAAQATLEQVKVEDIDTNLTVIKELLFPLIELGKWLYSLTEWQDNLKSTLVLLLLLYTIYRGWIWQMWPGVLLSLSFLMLWNKYCRNGRQIEAFRITTQPNRSTVELIVTLQEAASQLESGVQTGCIVLLKLRAILFAAFPQTTNKVACTLAAMAMIFSIVPLRHLAIIFLLEFYTRRMPLRKESSEKLIRRLREWWVRIPAAPVQLIKPRKRSSEQLIKIKEN